MKMTLIALLLLVALSTKALLGAAGPAPEQVLDTSGKMVRARTSYYIVPASPDVGGLAMASTGEDCPLDVVAIDGYQGQPLIFTPVNVNKGVIRVCVCVCVCVMRVCVFGVCIIKVSIKYQHRSLIRKKTLILIRAQHKILKELYLSYVLFKYSKMHQLDTRLN